MLLISILCSTNTIEFNDDDIFFKKMKEQIHLDDNLDWDIVQEDEKIQVLNYRHQNIKIPAIKVVIIDSVNLHYLKEAITDVNNHIKFMQDSYLIISDSLYLGKKKIYKYKDIIFYDTYQYLDLPFITDRHYVARAHLLDLENIIKINWELLDRKFFKSYDIDKMNTKNKSIFIDRGFGYWELEKLDEYKTKATYCIYLNPRGWIPSFVINLSNLKVIPNTVKGMIKEAKRLQKLD